MLDSLNSYRKQYFAAIANMCAKQDFQVLVVTHILPDRGELLEAIEKVAPISLVIAIPYSTHKPTLKELQKQYRIKTPSLEVLKDKNALIALAIESIDPEKPLIILEIGGYFAKAADDLQKYLKGKLLGIVEDTEAGIRQYSSLDSFPCPVISVARSSLKEAEDFLVGSSCIFSTEHLLRKVGFLMQGKFSLILGFGKVGKGIAHALLRRHCPVAVNDINPIRCTLAISEGFRVFKKNDALQNAEIIFGATGNASITAADFPKIKNGSLLVSCSSKDVEFDLSYLQNNYDKTEVSNAFDKYQNGDQFFYLLGNGRPINFLDGGVIGPILSLVQAEIIFALHQLAIEKNSPGILELNEQYRQQLAQKWLEYFWDENTGYYRYA